MAASTCTAFVRRAVGALVAILLLSSAQGRSLNQIGASPYADYADLLAPVLLLTQGNFERADQAVEELFVDISNEIAGVVKFLAGQNPPQVAINPPILFNNGAKNVSTNLAGAQGLAVGINYSPCFLSTSARGVDVTAAGINVQPNVVEVFAEGVAIWPWAINIQPALIYINPWGTDIAPEGISITPSLIAVAPHRVADAPSAVSVAPVGIAVP